MCTKNRMQTKLQPLGMDHLIVFLGGWGGGLGNYPKKFLHSKSKEKKSCTVNQGKKNRASLSTRRILLV